MKRRPELIPPWLRDVCQINVVAPAFRVADGYAGEQFLPGHPPWQGLTRLQQQGGNFLLSGHLLRGRPLAGVTHLEQQGPLPT